jgi:hypothetical protein
VGIPRQVTVKDRKYIERADPFHCAMWCGDIKGLDAPTQASRRCTLPGFRREWTETRDRDKARLKRWMGVQPYEDANGNYHHRPPEPEQDGCPGGWARCGFADSFGKYIRVRLQNGGHDSNPRVSSETPPHILDAIQYFERQYAHAEAEFRRQSR